MIVLWLVRCSETNISSATATRDSRMISASNGSIFVLTAIGLHPCFDDEVADPIQTTSLAWVDDGGGGFLFDDRWALHFFVERQPAALIESCLVDPTLVEVDPPSTLGCRAARSGWSEGGEVGIRDPDQSGQMQVDELHGPVEPEHEGALVTFVESGGHFRERRPSIRYWDANRVLLARIAHVCGACGHHSGRIEAFVLEEEHCVALQLVKSAIHRAHGFVSGSEHRGTSEVLFVVCGQHAPSAELAWGRRDDDLANVKLPGPGTAPALRGPTRSVPIGSSQAIEPPPAPISTMSTTGTLTGYPALLESCSIRYSVVTLISAPSMRDVLAVVPPMSRVIKLRSPISRPIAKEPTTPPTGPDSIMWIGCSLANPKEAMPPLDFITLSEPDISSLRRSWKRESR